MKRILFYGAVLLSAFTLTILSPVTASHFSHEDDKESPFVNKHFLRDVFPCVLSGLPVKTFFRATQVCKAWHDTQQPYLEHALKSEGHFMLYDHKKWSKRLPDTLLTVTLQNLYDAHGFAFMPYKQHVFLEGSVPLDEADIEPHIPTLYTCAFQAQKDSFSFQDILCLEAVLPWSRMIFDPTKKDAKARALTFLKDVAKSPQLVRFSPTLAPDFYKDEAYTFVLTTDELSQHKAHLLTLLETHIDHAFYVVAEEGVFVTNGGFSLSRTDLPNTGHLTLLDPKGTVTHLEREFLSGYRNQKSISLKQFPSLTQADEDFLAYAYVTKVILHLPNLELLGEGFLYNGRLTSLRAHLPVLTNLGNDTLSYAVLNNTTPLRLALPSLTFINKNCFSYTNIKKATFEFPSLVHIGREFCYSCPELSSVRFYETPQPSYVGNRFIDLCPALTPETKEHLAKTLKEAHPAQENTANAA